ncbi:RNA polymerase sigma factor SigJ [Cellulosimicrobium composti]|uniref:RNA polymerase sigma factor SigJ n=1 Tax=Cellulosimicrobium composti TaxID=2672572 RepID=UPI0037A28160
MTGPDATTGPEEVARAFQAERPRLLRLAYATTGSWSDAEDCVQDAWLRLRTQDPASIRNLAAWLTTTVGRLALDVLGSARVRRERYVGTWLPEPVVTPPGAASPVATAATSTVAADPADRVTLDEEVSMALLVVLERLSPAQRVAFVLHDVFGLPFEEVGDVVGRSPAAVRQLAARARKDVEAGRPRRRATRAEQQQVVEAFVAACAGQDLPALLGLLDPDVVLRGDGGGKVRTLRRTIHGAEPAGRVLLTYLRKPPETLRVVDVNGTPGLLVRDVSGVLTVMSFTVAAGRITALDIVRNPDKLGAVPRALLDADGA